MQDKSNNIMTDKGWEAMELILDKEMPQKKKRRFLIWWFFGGMLLLAAYLVIQHSTKSKQPQLTAYDTVSSQQSISIKNKDSEITKNVDSQLITHNTEIYIEEKKEINNSVSNNKSSVNTVVGDEFTDSRASDTQITTNQENENQSISRNEVAISNEKYPSIKSKSDDKLNAEKSIGGVVSKQEQSSIKEYKGVSRRSTSSINIENGGVEKDTEIPQTNLVDTAIKQTIEGPLLERLLLDLPKLVPNSDFKLVGFERGITVVASKIEKPGYWYGIVGGHFNWGPTGRLYGMDAQIDLGYSFKNELDLGASFCVGSFRYGDSISQQTAISTSGREMFSGAEAANVLNSSLSNVSHLDLGVHVGWNISQFFKLRADAGSSYLFSSIFDSDGSGSTSDLDTQDPQEIPVGPDMEEQEIMVENEKGGVTKFAYELDQKWFPYAGLSVQLKLNRKLAIDIGYQKVFGELYKESANPLSMDRLRFGVKYRFLKSISKP